MSLQKKLIFIFSLFLGNISVFSQETLPIYSDYLSDNVYLLHPSAAGIGNCGKIRFTARQQWAGVEDAPTLQTLSFHNKFGRNAAYGLIAFNDKNGYHSQKGLQLTYAYHLDMGNANRFNQLSFGLSFSAIQNQSDQRGFANDPAVSQLIESSGYFNADFSVAYHLEGLSSYFTVKNLLLSAKNNLNSKLEPLDLRNYIFSLGYFIGNKDKIQLEPSIMVQYKEGTGSLLADLNVKIYKTFPKTKTQLWLALSYRSSFDSNSVEKLKYISPILGVNYKKMMISYTYTKQLGDVVFADGFHQIGLGFNVFCVEPRASACPNINGGF